MLELEQIACPLQEGSATTLFEQRDFALGVPGRYPLVRCPRCGLLYQNPRIRMDQLELAYPANYPPHTKDPEISRVATGLLARVRDKDKIRLAGVQVHQLERVDDSQLGLFDSAAPAGASSRRSCRGSARVACSTSAAPWDAYGPHAVGG